MQKVVTEKRGQIDSLQSKIRWLEECLEASVKVRYSGPPLIRTPILPNNSALIKEVSFGEGALQTFIVLPAKNLRICVLST